MVSKEEVVRLGNEIGFEIVRTCSADPFTNYEETLRKRIRNGLYPKNLISYEEILKNATIYADPTNSLPEAKTIISLAFHYYTSESTDFTKQGEPHGVLARAYQKDVYGETWRRTKKFAKLLRKKGVKVAEESRVPLKMAAVRAGTGWQGKNSLILIEEFGSWITLSSLVVDTEFESDDPSPKTCGSCQACQRACPTQAIQDPGIINVNRCIDYLTGSSGSIPRELRSSIGNRLISCDRCQEVCPHNRLVNDHGKDIPQLNREFRHSPALIPLLSISEENFRNNYLDCDFISPRKEYLQRNVIVALGNIGDPVAIPALKRFQKGARPLLEEHATWALDRLRQREMPSKASESQDSAK
jgi:epoxyqueuosine reductase